MRASILRRCYLTIAGALALGTLPSFAHDPIRTKVTWEREIAPIVRARCAGCHAPGGAAPMALTTYEDVRPWARAIREEVLARRMPKWQAVRGFGDFSNDPSLSPFEIALFVAWVDGGAPASLKSPVPSAPGSGRPELGSPPVPSAPSTAPPPPVRRTVVPCSSRALAPASLVALQPIAPAGTAVRFTLALPDGSREPLLAVKDFDPRFPETYWLRTPISVPRRARLLVEPGGLRHCTVALQVRR